MSMDYFERVGLLNRNSEDLGVLANHDIAAVVFAPAAFCTSRTCSGDIRGHGTKVLKANAATNAINCPDCGNALYWKLVKRNTRGE